QADFDRPNMEQAEGAAAAQVRDFLQERGPLFAKLGQYLALRGDRLPRHYCAAFLSLTDHEPALGLDQIQRIVADNMNVPCEEAFPWISARPLAVGLLSQSHLAHTRDGAKVVVKVRRPDVGIRVEREFSAQTVLRELADMLPPAGRLDWAAEL